MSLGCGYPVLLMRLHSFRLGGSYSTLKPTDWSGLSSRAQSCGLCCHRKRKVPQVETKPCWSTEAKGAGKAHDNAPGDGGGRVAAGLGRERAGDPRPQQCAGRSDRRAGAGRHDAV
eukprot:5482462-Prymnesium_polylepis.1